MRYFVWGLGLKAELWECTFYDMTYGCLLLGAIALLLRRACPSVRPCILPSTWNNSAPNEQIFMKCYNEGVLEKSIVKIQVCLQSDNNNTHFT
jgi:hypothetical protein